MERLTRAEYKELAQLAVPLLEDESLYRSFSQHELFEYGVFFLPLEADVRFVPVEHMRVFKPFAGHVLKFIKLHNYNKPATAVRFNTKHKYATYRKVAKEKVEAFLLKQLEDMEEDLDKRLEALDLSNPEQATLVKDLQDEYRRKTESLSFYLGALEQYDFTLSNYFKYYVYYQAHIRYEDQGQVVSLEQHVATTKPNIIFIAEAFTHKQKAHSNKRIEQYLHSLEPVYSSSYIDLYAKKIE